jgi:hypothetical protein
MSSGPPELIALGTLVARPARPLSNWELECGVFDYYDHWSEIDQRLASVNATLAPLAEAFAQDMNNLAVYVGEILSWLAPERIRQAESVVVVGSMSEAFLVCARAAADLLGSLLGFAASAKPGQAPRTSLRELLKWAAANPERVRPEAASVWVNDWTWFSDLRTLRDLVAHRGAQAGIHCDGRQFNLWMHSGPAGWVTRRPLLPSLATVLAGLLSRAEDVATLVNGVIELPAYRVGSRVLQGVCVPALHRLQDIAPNYAAKSP